MLGNAVLSPAGLTVTVPATVFPATFNATLGATLLYIVPLSLANVPMQLARDDGVLVVPAEAFTLMVVVALVSVNAALWVCDGKLSALKVVVALPPDVPKL